MADDFDIGLESYRYTVADAFELSCDVKWAERENCKWEGEKRGEKSSRGALIVRGSSG